MAFNVKKFNMQAEIYKVAQHQDNKKNIKQNKKKYLKLCSITYEHQFILKN